MESGPDPLAKSFPILYYVLSQVDDSISGKSQSHPQLPPETQESVLTQFPHLNNPKVLAALTKAIPDNVAQIRSALVCLGPRPDPSALAAARERIADIQSALHDSLQEIETGENLGRVDDRVEREQKLREATEKETQIYMAVATLEDMHRTYEKQLSNAQDRLKKFYEVTLEELDEETDVEVNEEVRRIFKEAESRVVKKADLFGQQLKVLPEKFGKLHGLTHLNVSQNQLEVLPDSIAGLQKLEHLDVSSNLLQCLPDSIGLLIHLKVVNVSGNKLKMLPETLSACSSLVELDASFNNLLGLPVNLGYGLGKIEKLSIQLNKISYLPTSICQLKSLKYFDAHFNQIRSLPSEIGKLTNLEVLILNGNFNNLTEIPETISNLCNLRELDLSDNQIRVLPDRFGRLEKLTKLNLDQNPLEVPPMDVVNKGTKAVKEFMDMRWYKLVGERQRGMHQANMPQNQTGWFAWGSAVFGNMTSGGRKETKEDQWLYEQL